LRIKSSVYLISFLHKWPGLIFTFLFITLTVLHFIFLISNSINNYGDTSLLVSHVQSISVGDGWASDYLASNIQALKNSGENALQWCDSLIGAPLIQINSGMAEHAYLYLVVLGVFAKLSSISALNVYMGILAIAHMAPLVYLFFLLKGQIRKTLMFALLVAGLYTHIIVLNLLNAQPHIEQLIYLFLPPFLYLLFKRATLGLATRRSYLNLFALGTLCMGVSERVSMVCGFITLSLTVFLGFKGLFSKKDNVILGLGILQLSWFVIWNGFFATSFYYSAITLDNILGNFQNLFSPDMAQHTVSYILVNILTLVIIFQLKFYSMWALIAFLPNLLLTVGGAEKDAFSISQYHALYFSISFTLFIIVVFYSFTLKLNVTRFWHVIFRPSTIVLNSLFLIVAIPFINESHSDVSITKFPTKLAKPFVPKSLNSNLDNGPIDNYLSSLPRDTVISLPEEVAMKFVTLGFYNLRYYPTDLSSAKVTIAPILVTGDSRALVGGLPSWFQNDEESAKLGDCVRIFLSAEKHKTLTSFTHRSKEFLVLVRN
jgi:hypothetical protein